MTFGFLSIVYTRWKKAQFKSCEHRLRVSFPKALNGIQLLWYARPTGIPHSCTLKIRFDISRLFTMHVTKEYLHYINIADDVATVRSKSHKQFTPYCHERKKCLETVEME